MLNKADAFSLTMTRFHCHRALCQRESPADNRTRFPFALCGLRVQRHIRVNVKRADDMQGLSDRAFSGPPAMVFLPSMPSYAPLPEAGAHSSRQNALTNAGLSVALMLRA